jgi:energy-coupling factor transporter ATP-binding protein EcfA2
MRGVRVAPVADRVLIVGQTQKGKTTLARFLAELLQPCRLIVFDPKEEFPDGAWGFPAARSPLELAGAMHQPIVHYIPSGFDREELEEACQIVWETPGPYVWWIDEASELTNPNYCPTGLRLGCTQGAKQQKLVIALTQRLAESHPVFRSQADHVFVFVPAPIELDLKEIAKAIRREPGAIKLALEELHAQHGDYSHIWYVLDGDELRFCAPIPLDEHPMPTGVAPGAPGDSEGEPGETMDDPGVPGLTATTDGE